MKHVADPGSSAFLTHVSVIRGGKKFRTRDLIFKIDIPDHISESLLTNCGLNLLKLLFKSVLPIRDAILTASNVKPTFFQDRLLSFSYKRSQKIEYIRFLNKIQCRTKTFSFSSQSFWSKSNRFFQFPNFFLDFKKFCSGFRNL